MSKTWTTPDAALPITRAELLAFGITPEELAAGEARGKLTTWGPWQLPVNYWALCTSTVWDENTAGYTHAASTTVYGMRTLSKPRQEGSCLEGRVHVNGKSVRGFTSSQLFELEDGSLINIATIHACLNQ